jgi:hypothetical protein
VPGETGQHDEPGHDGVHAVDLGADLLALPQMSSIDKQVVDKASKAAM